MSNPISKTVEEGKTMAIISYITVIGLIVAFVMNNDKKNTYATYHIRQSLGLGLLAIAFAVLDFIPYIGWIFGLGFILIFVLWILGLINAVNGEEKPLPIVGKLFEDWFKNI